MTRVNLVPPSELCDQHLLAEHREITRIPNAVARGRVRLDIPGPADYTLGAGHVRFFYTRLGWLRARYDAVHATCLARGFAVTHIWPAGVVDGGWYDVTPEALAANRARIAERMPGKARWTQAREVA